MIDSIFWRNKRVFVTGHTGFKGSWLCLWLHELGAIVQGYSLSPPTTPNLFNETHLSSQILSEEGDIRDLTQVTQCMQQFKPDIVFHLAAQSLVRLSYELPLDTYSTNVMGTLTVLEAIRQVPSVKAVVNVTSDKCYENREWPWGYREIDPMGGFDPYSSSKGCAELVTASYRQSFFNPQDYSNHSCALASARAGNVVGGGDWATDRLIPDLLQAFSDNKPVNIRHPNAIRPWQHVLEPISGYMLLAEKLYKHGMEFAESWNFGPQDEDAKPVHWIADELTRLWGMNAHWSNDNNTHPHEAHYLKLDCSKARIKLGWKPVWTLEHTLSRIVAWHKAWLNHDDMHDYTITEIHDYMNAQQGDKHVKR